MSKMTPQEVQSFIAQGRQNGKTDLQIYVDLRNNPKAKDNFVNANKAGMSNEQIAQTLKLNISPKAEKVQYDKPTFLERAGAGADNNWSGLKQGGLYVADGLAGLSNKILGTNFDTDDYEKFTANKKAEKEHYQDAKKQSGFSGIDVAEMLGEMGSLGPLATAGRGYQGVKVLSKAGAKVTAQNAGLGALGSMVGFAENSDKRMQNATTGAMFGAGGAVVGKKIGEQLSKRVATTPQNVDIALERGLAKMDLKLEDLPADVANALRADAKKALKAGKVLDDDAIARKAFLESKGFKPTHAQVTRNASDWTNERELAKLDSTEGILTNKYVNDDDQLRQMLADEIMATGGKKTDDYAFNQELLQTAQAKIAKNKQRTSEAYGLARDAVGNDLPMDATAFVDDVYKSLGKFADNVLPTEAKKVLKTAKKKGLTFGESQELVKVLNGAYKGSLINGQPTMHTHALKQAKETLEAWQQKTIDGTNQTAQHLWKNARHIHKQNRELIESMPLLKDAEKGVEPDKMFSKHIIGGNIGQLRTTMDFLKAENPQLVADIKQSVLEHIAKNAINQSNGFSPAGMKKVLDSLGEPRLKSIFSDDELKRLKDLRMAGELLKQAPIGSNINHSNTASTLANIFGMMIDKVPFASIVKGVRDNINARSQLTGKITMPNVRTVYDDDTVHYATKAGFGAGVANADE